MPTTRLNLHVQSGTDAPHRVLCVCRRRGLEVIELGYRDEQMALTVAGPERQVGQIHRWLAAVVNVIEVKGAEPAAPVTVGPAGGAETRTDVSIGDREVGSSRSAHYR